MPVPERHNAEVSSATVPFSERDIREAARLLALIANSDGNGGDADLCSAQLHSAPQARQVDREVLLSRAKKHMRDRQLRRQFFNRATFGEPAWDTLLVLYISDYSGRRLTVGKLADWIDAPLSTTQRWIAYLQKEHLVDKEGHPDDKRMAYVRLLDKGRAKLDDYFAAASD